jgi:hypothetical protein
MESVLPVMTGRENKFNSHLQFACSIQHVISLFLRIDFGDVRLVLHIQEQYDHAAQNVHVMVHVY